MNAINDIKINFRMRKFLYALAMVFATSAFAEQPADVPFTQQKSACVPQTCGSSPTPFKKQVVHKRVVVHNKIVKPKATTDASASEKYDPLANDPSISLKDTPTKEIDLPGVLHVDGESAQAFDPSKSHKISWGNQGIQPIILSLTGPDLIVTPFNDPYIVGNSYLNIKKRTNSNNVYVSFNFPEGTKPVPVSIFIEDPAGGPALGLQLIPKEIAQQVYTVVDDTDRLSGGVRRQSAKGVGYTTHVQELMELAAFGRTPSGYTIAPFDLPPIIMHGLKLDAMRRLSNTEGDLYVYEVTNPTSKTVTIAEKEFDGPRVKAVSIFPKPELRESEKATVVVFAKKPEGK